MKHDMELRKATWSAALRLAFVVSGLAAIVAVTLSAAGDVSPAVLVSAVMVIGFVASWVQTGRVAHVHKHQVAIVPDAPHEPDSVGSLHVSPLNVWSPTPLDSVGSLHVSTLNVWSPTPLDSVGSLHVSPLNVWSPTGRLRRPRRRCVTIGDAHACDRSCSSTVPGTAPGAGPCCRPSSTAVGCPRAPSTSLVTALSTSRSATCTATPPRRHGARRVRWRGRPRRSQLRRRGRHPGHGLRACRRGPMCPTSSTSPPSRSTTARACGVRTVSPRLRRPQRGRARWRRRHVSARSRQGAGGALRDVLTGAAVDAAVARLGPQPVASFQQPVAGSPRGRRSLPRT